MTRKLTRVPLDSIAATFRIGIPEFAQSAVEGFPKNTVLAEPATKIAGVDGESYPDVMVSHFATCPNAGEFSKAKSKAAERAIELAACAEALYQAIGNGDAMRAASVRYQRFKAGG